MIFTQFKQKLIFGEDFSHTNEITKEGSNMIRVDQSVIDYFSAVTKILATEVSEGIRCFFSLKEQPSHPVKSSLLQRRRRVHSLFKKHNNEEFHLTVGGKEN